MKKSANYNKAIPNYGSTVTVEDFMDCVTSGGFSDYDGFGLPVKNNLMDGEMYINPSEIKNIPKDATHIHWFNR